MRNAFDDIRGRVVDLVAEVQTVVMEEDPLGLIKIGAPPDEYDGEAREITERLINGDWPVSNVSGMVDALVATETAFAVFVNTFGMSVQVEDEVWERLGKRISELMSDRPSAGLAS